jgi:hypothetical protein
MGGIIPPRSIAAPAGVQVLQTDLPNPSLDFSLSQDVVFNIPANGNAKGYRFSVNVRFAGSTGDANDITFQLLDTFPHNITLGPFVIASYRSGSPFFGGGPMVFVLQGNADFAILSAAAVQDVPPNNSGLATANAQPGAQAIGPFAFGLQGGFTATLTMTPGAGTLGTYGGTIVEVMQ